MLVAAALFAACGSDSPKSDDATTIPSKDCGSPGDTIKDVAVTIDGAIEGMQQFEGMSSKHVDGCVNYAQTPPVGGNHSQRWQGCDFYDSAIVKEQAVHSMEHGAVWVTYRDGLGGADLDALRALASNDFVLISQWDASLPAPVVLSAWGLQLRVESATDPRVKQFVDAFAQGPQTPEPGAPCRDGGVMES